MRLTFSICIRTGLGNEKDDFLLYAVEVTGDETGSATGWEGQVQQIKNFTEYKVN